MKKIVLTMVALMAFTLSFAETKSENVVMSEVNNDAAVVSHVDKRFDMSCDMHRLAVLLDLDEWQMDAIEVIHNMFNDDMQSLATTRGPWQKHLIHQALKKDASQMQRVLNDKQLKTYMQLMVVTLRNRHL